MPLSKLEKNTIPINTFTSHYLNFLKHWWVGDDDKKHFLKIKIQQHKWKIKCFKNMKCITNNFLQECVVTLL